MSTLAAAAPRRYLTSYQDRKRVALRRDANLAGQRCINENAARTHGPPTRGVRCVGCYETYRRTW